MRRIKIAAVLVTILLLATVVTTGRLANAQTTLLYDLDFGSPPHTVGLPPVVGAGPSPRDTVSLPLVVTDTPTVVSSSGALTNQPLEFDSLDGHGDQISLRLYDLPPSSLYCIESEVLIRTNTPGKRFVILHDTPQIRNIEFRNGVISAYIPGGVTDPYPGTPIGTYTLGEVIVVGSEVDLASDSWKIYLDNSLAYSGSFGGASQINSIRISTDVALNTTAGGGLGTLAAIDNFRVAAQGCAPEINIDIKPGGDQNSINPGNKGKIPVAILSTPDFDAPNEVDRASLTFGRTGNEDSLVKCKKNAEDVNDDGLLDVVCHFNTQDAGFQAGDTEGILRGQTVDGAPIEGRDSVKIVR